MKSPSRKGYSHSAKVDLDVVMALSGWIKFLNILYLVEVLTPIAYLMSGCDVEERNDCVVDWS